MQTTKEWFMMQVLHTQLNAHNEGLVYDVGIAFIIIWTQ